MSGCAVCVQDLYVEALDEYTKALATLRTSLSLLNVPEDKWPPEVRTGNYVPAPKKNVALSAFEELEARLKQKHSRDTSESVVAGL